MTAISSVVLVDKRIHDHETIVSAVKTDGVRCIIFDVFEVDTYCQEQASTAFQYILNKIAELGVTGSFSNIGIVQHNTGAPFHRFFAQTQGEESTVMGVETTDPTLQSWAGFAAFMVSLKNTYGIQNVDLMACALYSDPNWKYVIDTLAAQTGVTVRASTDDTGAAALGGDWFLESHTGVNLKDVYFTDAIEDFRGVLYVGSNYWTVHGSYRRPVKSFAVGGLELWGSESAGGTNNTSVNLSNTVGICSNSNSAAALKTDGSVVVWGNAQQGASYAVLTENVSVPSNSLTSGVVDIVGNEIAYAAIKSDGSVVIWGRITYGGNNNTGVNLTDVIDVYPTSTVHSFAALKSNGSVVSWGNINGGGSTTTPVNAASSLTSGVVLIYSNGGSYAALKTNGSIVTWGSTTYGGSTTSPVNVASSLTADVVAVYSMNSAYAALKSNGSLVIWGSSTYGGTSPGTSVNTGVIHVFTTAYSAVALKTDSSIVHWGNSDYTGTAPSLTNVVTLCANLYAFAALKSDGTVVVWGNNTSYGSSASTPVNSASSLTSGASIIALYSNYWAFAALKSDGTVVCWGHATNGGTVPSGLTGVVSIRASSIAFAALKSDGSVVIWGDRNGGGSNNTSASISSGIVDVFNNQFSFSALKTTSSPSYDLSMSYYTETDRLSILCSSDYRRTANLTANSNKFTVSLTRSLQKFNYNMPTNQALTLIVPDYQTAPYSLTSTITIPASNGGVNSKSFLITSEIGERVNISGVGTYVNYGTYVYKVETNGTYTKTTSLTVNNTSYNVYGGDGIYYSGIALYYRFGSFSIPAKTFGDASFNITAPVTDSSGAFTYTSSDTTVATVTTSGTVTIIKAGTTTITATQAASGSYPSNSIAATLTVSKAVSTLGALTVPAKVISDAPFALTAPTSTNSSIVSPVYTITSAASMIVPPPDIRDISYGTTWIQLGVDIDGEAALDRSGTSVSMSADGTVVAIGAALNDGSATFNSGHVRVYELSGNTWVQRGSDIEGEGQDWSGGTGGVSLSANGNIVAIGAFLADGSGNDTGHVRVYRYTPNKPNVTNQLDPSFGPVGWTRLGADIDGEAPFDRSGSSVSLSADGTIVSIGAANNNGLDSSGNSMLYSGHVRVYKYTPTKTVNVTNQTDLSFGPVGWTRMGADIDGEAAYDHSGYSNSLSADGTTVAIGAPYADISNNDNRGHVRVYRYNALKTTPQLTNQNISTFGPAGWDRLGSDIDGEAAYDNAGYYSVCLSANGNTVAIGSHLNVGPGSIGQYYGSVRIYDLSGNTWVKRGQDIDGEAINDRSGCSLSISADGNIVAIGTPYNDGTVANSNRGHVRIYFWNGNAWAQRGQDIDGENGGIPSGEENSGYPPDSVSLSSNGTRVAIGAPFNNGPVAGELQRGHVRVYQIATTNALTYSSSNSSIADVCGNLLLIKGVNGTSTITASQTGNTVTGRLDVSGTTYTLQYNPITYTIDSSSVASVSTYGTVTLTGAIGTSTITATQPETLNYASRSVTGTLDVSGTVTVLGPLTIPAKVIGDASFSLTAPTTNNSGGAFTYTSSNTAVATVTSGGVVTIIGIGTTTITATQASSGNYSTASVSGSLVVNFGNTNTITRLLTDGASVIPTPISDVSTTYGSTWNQLGADIVGKVAGDESGTSISASADGTIVAIGARSNSTNRGTVRVYKYNDVSWNQLGSDINGEASSDYSGQSVSLSANGRVVAIGANMNDGSGNLLADSGHVRIYEFNGTTWTQRGGDIDGEANGDQSGISVSLSEDGNIVAIGAIMNDGSGNALSNSGHVRVYKYNASKTSPQLTDQSLATFGPAGWDRLGADIDGEAVNDQSGFSVSLSADGATLAIGANFNDGTSGTVDTSNNRGHVRVYRYNASKTDPQLTNQSLTTFGPAGWDRMGSDIDGEVAADQSGFSVSLSADGSAVAIGSPLYDVSGVTNAGRARVFAWNGTSWVQRGGNINGVNLNENIGDSVSLSADGNILSVSSFMKVANYNYNSSTNTWSQIGANVTGAALSTSNIGNALAYSPHVYLDATNTSSYNGSTWTNLGSLGGNVVMTNMGTFDAADNGGSFHFNGTNNYGQLNITSTTLTSFTYLAVVKTTRLNTGYATILDFGNDNLLFCTSNNVLQLYNPSITSNFSLNAGVWYVFALTVSSGGAITFYVNGVSVLTGTETMTSRTNSAWGIGAGITASEQWNGKISALAIYHNRVLTASEVANVSNTLQTYRVSLSSQGNILAVGAREYDGTTGTSTNIGVGRVYRIDTSGNYTYSSNNTTIADVCGNIILPKTMGATTIAFTQSASGATASRSGTIPLTISGITPTIGALTAPAKNFGDAAFDLTAPTSNSGGAFTYTSSNTAVATVTSGGGVTIVGVGTTTITATQAASGNFNEGSVSSSLVVSASLSNFNVPAKTYGDASFNLANPDTTDNTVGFTFASSNTSVATLSGDGGRTVTIVGVGSTVITATQAATANRGQLDISATLVVSPATPVITLAPITKAYGNASFRPVPTTTNTDTSGGLAFTFTSNNIAVVSMLDASLVRINGVGTATLSITQAASANFTDASSSVVITVNKGVSGFSASTFTVAANKTFGDAAFAITNVPISSSTGAITYSSSDEAVAVITSNGSGNAITLVGQGTVTFTASQAESALYTADTTTSNTLTVARKTAALTRDIPSADTISKAYGDANFTVIATNESNGAFSFTSSDPSFATIDASTGVVTIVAVGSTTITATRAQTAQYNASSVSWTLNIARGTTTLTGISSMTRNVTVSPFTVTATSASDGAVSYALQDPSSTVLTIHPTTGRIRLKSPGSAVIVASQAQGTLYDAPSNLTATITVTAAGNTLQGATLTNSYDLDDMNLNGASLANATIINTNFSSSNLGNSNFNNSNVTNANMSSADLSGSTMRNATMNGVNFTSARLQRTDLSGANVRNSIFNSADLSGSTLTRLDASGASFINANLRGANLSNADFTNANMTNADIDGADITNVTFTIPQKLQLLKSRGNRVRSEIQVSQVLGSVLLPILSAGSAVRDVVNIANATFKVMLPTTSLVASDTIPDITLDISNFAYFYFPILENEYFQIQGVKYYISGSTVINYATGAAVENTSYGIKAIRLLAGSLTVIVNSQNTLSTSSFVVPSIKQNTDAPFSPTTLPTSNSTAPIVYMSSNTNVATIHSSTGVITPVADQYGFVRFTASQSATETHESASITSNELFINKKVDLTLVGLNQTFSLSTLASLDASSIAVDATDATAVFYIRLSDMTNLFQYQTDAFDINNLDASDVKYYVFHRTMPAELHINPSHAMMNKTESAGMLGSGVQEIGANKSLVKHDFIRYIALRLFNTHYGVDLLQNEQELHENITYLGETIQNNIDTILSGISTTSASQDMPYDASGNKYLTNDASGNTNLCRELMRQIAAAEPSRFYNNGADTTTSGIRPMPLHENDSINFKLTITAAEGQNIVTGVNVIPSRSYMIKMILKNTVNTTTNDTNTVVTDSEMYPNSYPYSTSVVTYAPTAESSSGVYNVYSPPAPIPTARYGYNGWYYANSTTWVNVAPAVRDRVKWVLPPNAAGSSTVADLRYVRMNLKVFNQTSLPFLVVTTQAGSSRKYTISAAPNSLANGTVYSFYMNFNTYTREPATIGATNTALAYSNVGSGSFTNGEVVTSIAVETDSEAAVGSVEFTLSSVVIGEAGGEKEYGFSANV